MLWSKQASLFTLQLERKRALERAARERQEEMDSLPEYDAEDIAQRVERLIDAAEDIVRKGE